MVSGSDPRRTKSEARVADPGDEEVCWICLDDAKQNLLRPCLCPRWVHARCMARWQLQCSGKSEENRCKFCQAELPNWRAALFKDVLERDDEAETSEGLEDGDSDGSVDADGTAMPRDTSDGRRIVSSGGSHGGSSSASSTPGSSSFLPRPEPIDPSAAATAERRRLAALSRRSSVDGSAAANDSSPSMGDVKGDIIVKFNNMSFRCKVRTGHEGLEDFMEQIREKCGIPEHKMRCLNLTYRCKDPNTGSQMTLQGVNESAFDAAVLCSAAQDKIKQRRRASRDGGRRASAEGKPPAYPESNGSKEDGVSTSAPASGGPGSSSGTQSDKSSGETSKASGKAKLRGKDLDATAAPASPGKSGRFEYRGCDATSTRAERRRNSLESHRRNARNDGLIAFGDGSVIAASGGFRSRSDPDESASNANVPSSGRFYFRRGARRLSAPPPSSSALTSVANAEADPQTVDAEEVSLPLRRARRPWPSFMSALTRSKA